MAKCVSCGGESETCQACGRELHLHFIDFIDKMEIIYAILLAWGFAEATRAVIGYADWDLAPLLIVDALVFVRFFFAPERNLRSIALALRHFPRWHWLVFLYDIPLLLFHSYAYYSMCVAISEGSCIVFYQWLIILLGSNVVWLVSITMRIKYFDKSTKVKTFSIWSINNTLHIASLVVIFVIYLGPASTIRLLHLSKSAVMLVNPEHVVYWLAFVIALSNCFIDLVLSSSDYMGFRTN
jgi:hypothetical protein